MTLRFNGKMSRRDICPSLGRFDPGASDVFPGPPLILDVFGLYVFFFFLFFFLGSIPLAGCWAVRGRLVLQLTSFCQRQPVEISSPPRVSLLLWSLVDREGEGLSSQAHGHSAEPSLD